MELVKTLQPNGTLGLAWAVVNNRQVFSDDDVPLEVKSEAAARGITILTDPADVPSRRPTGIYTRGY